jgi:hypothetical protein
MNNIIDPSDNQAYSIHSINGKRLLKNYIKFYNANMNAQTGGMWNALSRAAAGAAAGAEKAIVKMCGWEDPRCLVNDIVNEKKEITFDEFKTLYIKMRTWMDKKLKNYDTNCRDDCEQNDLIKTELTDAAKDFYKIIYNIKEEEVEVEEEEVEDVDTSENTEKPQTDFFPEIDKNGGLYESAYNYDNDDKDEKEKVSTIVITKIPTDDELKRAILHKKQYAIRTQEYRPQAAEREEAAKQRHAQDSSDDSDSDDDSDDDEQQSTGWERRQAWGQPRHPRQPRQPSRTEVYNKTRDNLINIHTAIKESVGVHLINILYKFEFINKHENMYLLESKSNEKELNEIYTQLINSIKAPKHILNENHVALIVEVINEIYMIFKDNYRLFVRADYKGPNTGTNFEETDEETKQRIKGELSKHDQYLKKMFINGSFVDNQANFEDGTLNVEPNIYRLDEYIPKDRLRYDISDFIFFNDAQNKIKKRNISRQQAREDAKQNKIRKEQSEQTEKTQIRLGRKHTLLEEIKTYIEILTGYDKQLQKLINQKNETLPLESIQKLDKYVDSLNIEEDLKQADYKIENAEKFINDFYQTGGSNLKSRIEQSIMFRQDKRKENLKKRRQARQEKLIKQAQEKLIKRVVNLQQQIKNKIEELNEENKKVRNAHVQ